MMKISIVLLALMLNGCIAQKKDTDNISNQLEAIRKELATLKSTVYETQKVAALTLAGHCKMPANKVAPKK